MILKVYDLFDTCNSSRTPMALVFKLIAALAICLSATLAGCRTVGTDIISPVETKAVEVSEAVEEVSEAVDDLPASPEKEIVREKVKIAQVKVEELKETVKIAQVKVEELKETVKVAQKETARVEIQAQAVEKEIVKVKAVNKTLISIICIAGALFGAVVFVKAVFF